jgi:hypothetical protein
MLKTKPIFERGPLGNVVHHGQKSVGWKGDKATKEAGRARARSMYEIINCEKCGKPAVDRHHKDGNTLNNKPSNIIPLCRRCHMKEDGRLERFKKSPRNKKSPKPCVNCSRVVKVTRHGRCSKCSEYLRKNEVEWTKERAEKRGRHTPDRPCTNCGRMVGVGWCKGRCPTCRMHLANKGFERPVKK